MPPAERKGKMHSTNREILKTLRGDILQFIYKSQVARVKKTSIQSAFYAYYPYADIDRAISYLVDRGFLEKEQLTSPIKNRAEDFYSISADGMLIVEGTMSDKGIYMEVEDE